VNELASRIARAVAAGCSVLACAVSIWAGSGLVTVVFRSVAVFGLTWILSELLVRRVVRTLVQRALEDRKPGQIDITLD
jgi:hypothetical protein